MLTHLIQILTERAVRLPDAVALGGQQGLGWRNITSGELQELTGRLAEELALLGVAAGDRVVLWAPNHWRTPVYLFALWKLRAVAVPFDREMNPEAAARILEAVEARCVIAGFGERPVWARGAEVVEWWEPGDRAATAPASFGFRVPGSEGSASRSCQGREGQLGTRDDLAAIFFTSGTTGSPKGCMISHGNLCSQVEALQHTVPLGPGCRLASILPLSHLFELTVGLLYPPGAGCGDPLRAQPARPRYPAGAQGAADHPHHCGAAAAQPDGDGPG